jgi:CubicO group peptidase (beta-lactamase class C family)
LKPRLFEPLGIENPNWPSSPEGNSLGGYGLMLCTEDIAKFGQLYLQKGKWNGKQLIPEKWIEQRRASKLKTTRRDIQKSESIGFRAMAFNSGAAPTTLFAATAPTASYVL